MWLDCETPRRPLRQAQHAADDTVHPQGGILGTRTMASDPAARIMDPRDKEHDVGMSKAGGHIKS